jgi:hypothetical protein
VGYLGFQTDETYVDSTIHPDGTFTVQLHAATHEPVMAGLRFHCVGTYRFDGRDKGIPLESPIYRYCDRPRDAPALAAIKGGFRTGSLSICDDPCRNQGPITIIGSMQTNIRMMEPSISCGDSRQLRWSDAVPGLRRDLNRRTDTANVSVVVPIESKFRVSDFVKIEKHFVRSSPDTGDLVQPHRILASLKRRRASEVIGRIDQLPA